MNQTRHQRGSMLLVVVFLATAIAILATISSGRVVTETRAQEMLEDETRAYNEAFSQLHMALNVVNSSPYNALNQNMVIRNALADAGLRETSEEAQRLEEAVGGDRLSNSSWILDPVDVEHGYVEGTNVRVYRAREYIQRLQKLRGETVEAEIDAGGQSDSYFAIEAVGRSGDAVRLVSALVRENEPFSSFVFFQNRHPLGVSGSPRGLIHANDQIHFYFPNGNYQDYVSAVNGFEFKAGADGTNTTIADGNPNATSIALEAVDFDILKTKATLFTVADGLDAEIKMYGDGRLRIRSMTSPRWELVEYPRTRWVFDRVDTITATGTRTVQTGTTTETYTESVYSETIQEAYVEEVPVYEWQDENYQELVEYFEDRTVTKTRAVPVWETRTVTKTRWVQIFVPYDADAGGGTSVAGGGGVAGEYEWIEEEYETTEDYIKRYEPEDYTITETVKIGEELVTKTRSVRVQVDTLYIDRTRDVNVYVDVEKEREVAVYGTEEYEYTYDQNVYLEEAYIEEVLEFRQPQLVQTDYVMLSGDASGTIYVDGRITELEGDLNGRLTIVGNEKVRVTGSIRYMDDSGQTAMLNGDSYTLPYERNEAYTGTSVLGVIARTDIVITDDVPDEAELNATLMAVTGRVGIDGFAITTDGDPTQNFFYGMTAEEIAIEQDYERTEYHTHRFRKDSMRRIGGFISNDRILETYIRPDSNGNAYVDSGFKRGSMKFDLNLLFNPPPNFIEVPRPVLQFFTPVFIVRNDDF